jgi:aspartate racemase
MADSEHPSRINSKADGGEAVWRTLRSVLRAQRTAPPLQPIPRDREPEASFGQRRLWFLERLTAASAVHNDTIAHLLVGKLSVPALERALGEIVRRHEALRTTLRWSGDALVQDIHPPSGFVVEIEDLQLLAAAQLAVYVETRTHREAGTPFDINRPPLLRARLFRLAVERHCLVLTLHHLASDCWSFEVLMRELCDLYTAFVANRPSPLQELTFQYADWSAWQRVRLQEQHLQRLLQYWQSQMRGPVQSLIMPTDHPRRALRPHRSGWLDFDIAPSLTEAVQHLAKQEGATCYMVLLAAFQAFLHRYTGQEDIVVGSPVANRYHAEVQRLIGFFVNTLPMRTRISPGASFRQHLSLVRKTALAAYEHQDLPFDLLVQGVGAASRSGEIPLFQVVFAFQNHPRSTWRLPNLSIESWHVSNGTAMCDITLSMWDAHSGFGGLLEYDADLFDGATASQWLRHFKALLDCTARYPDIPIEALPLLNEGERTELLQTWNATSVPYPRDLPIHRVFAQCVRDSPETIALAFDGGTMTYRQLECRSNRLARYLHRQGVARGMLVGVCLERSTSFVVAILAILKSGGAFVPIDPSWPEERIGIALACVPAAVTQNSLASRLRFVSARLVSIDGDSQAIDLESGEPLDAEVSADDLAYVMYTSGSTGGPKGVCVPHRAVVRLVRGANYAEFTRTDVFLQLAPIAFDASTFEIWGALLNGATLAIPSAQQLSLSSIGQVLRQFGVTILWLTTGLFQAMVDKRLADLCTVQQLLVGGDVLSAEHAERFLRQASDCRLINCYGPTENTTFTTFHQVHLSSWEPGGSIPIGRPVSNTQVYVLDELLQLVPIGVAGAAYVGGDGLMRGYLDDPMSTSTCLVRNPFTNCPGQWLYRTGDIVRWRRVGVLEFLGREDDQVKSAASEWNPEKSRPPLVIVRQCGRSL